MKKNNIIRILHGKIHECFHITFLEIKGLIKSFFHTNCLIEDYPVDFVVTWVNGGDSAWKEKKNSFTQNALKNKDGDERYRDWGFFKYWFRAVERYAPWFNKIYLITDRQTPIFLDINCDRIKIIDHTEIIKNEFLPTFNSCAIEANICNIKGLSEHFIYFNDDVFLTRPVKKSDFFKNGLPKYMACAISAMPPCGTSIYCFQVFNTMGVLNSKFSIRKSIENNPDKWFSYKGINFFKKNKRAFEDGYISSFAFSHLGVPYRKSTWDTVVSEFRSNFNETSSHRFRSVFDIVHYIFIVWEIMSGSFEPVEKGYYGKAFLIEHESQFIDSIEAIKEKRYRMVCLNDSEFITYDMFAKMKESYLKTFEEIFPQKSIFEK